MVENEISKIASIVRNYYQIEPEQFASKSRKREVVQARQIAMYLAKQHTTESLAVIGHKIGRKDHATVLHANRTIKNLIETDKQIRSDIQDIEKILKSELKSQYLTNQQLEELLRTALINQFHNC